MDGMYAEFAGAKTGHGRAAFFWCFVLPNSFSSAFATPSRRERYFVFTIGTVRRPGKKPPRNRARFTFGFGTREANFAMKSRGSNITWVALKVTVAVVCA